MIYTYLLQSLKDGSFYTGISIDLHNRVNSHNDGRVSSTKLKRPYTLVYFKEHSDYAQARKHEKWLKKKNRDYKLYLAQLAPPA